MQVKTFEALTIKDAIKAVKNEYGADAVILSTRRKSVTEGGNASMVEVSVAVPEKRSLGASAAMASHGKVAMAEEIAERMQSIETKMSLLNESMPSKTRVEAIESGMEELKILMVEALRAKSGSFLENIPENLIAIDQQLRLMGVDEAHIASLIKYLCGLPPPENTKAVPENPTEYYRSHALRWMFKRVTIAPRWSVIPGSTSVHVFIGPTGVGKTSLIAKIAASFHLKEKAKTLLVSFDNHRLAAAEQLRVYSRVMGMPFEVITSADEIKQVLEKYRDIEMVLIDTAGRSPKAQSFAQDLEGFNALEIPIDKHLVLSITEKEQQLERAIRQFAPLGIQSLMFSKLDESWSYGEIFNLSAKWSLPLSYFGVGQRIPEDLERASRERVVERIFGI